MSFDPDFDMYLLHNRQTTSNTMNVQTAKALLIGISIPILTVAFLYATCLFVRFITNLVAVIKSEYNYYRKTLGDISTSLKTLCTLCAHMEVISQQFNEGDSASSTGFFDGLFGNLDISLLLSLVPLLMPSIFNIFKFVFKNYLSKPVPKTPITLQTVRPVRPVRPALPSELIPRVPEKKTTFEQLVEAGIVSPNIAPEVPTNDIANLENQFKEIFGPNSDVKISMSIPVVNSDTIPPPSKSSNSSDTVVDLNIRENDIDSAFKNIYKMLDSDLNSKPVNQNDKDVNLAVDGILRMVGSMFAPTLNTTKPVAKSNVEPTGLVAELAKTIPMVSEQLEEKKDIKNNIKDDDTDSTCSSHSTGSSYSEDSYSKDVCDRTNKN